MKIADASVAEGADILEVGTPLLLGEGIHAILALRKKYPDVPIVADVKIMDAGYAETIMCANAGADGCFTKYVKCPERVLHEIPENVSFDEAALSEPACVAYNAVLVNSHINPGEPFVIIGPGPSGLFAVQMARIAGAYPIILMGTTADSDRLNFGKSIGADSIVNVIEEDPVTIINKLTDHMGVPRVIDAAGNTPAVKTSMDIVKRGGQITKIAWGAKPLELSLDPIIQKAAFLKGSFSHTWTTGEAVLQLIKSGKLDMKQMISHTYKLDDWLKAFETIDKKIAVKAVIHPNA